MKPVLVWCGWWVLAMAFWFAMTSTTAGSEIVVGAVVSTLAASVAELVTARLRPNFRIGVRWWMQVPALLGRAVMDSLLIALTAGRFVVNRRRVRGRFLEVPAPHDLSSRRRSGEQFLLTVGGTLAPNTIVVGYDPDRKSVVVHQLIRKNFGTTSDLFSLK
jgi:multisubunit Na+/H+ antiporter MnhE subunit